MMFGFEYAYAGIGDIDDGKKGFKDIVSELLDGMPKFKKGDMSSYYKELIALQKQQMAIAQEEANKAAAEEPDIDTLSTDNASGLSNTNLTSAQGAVIGDNNKKKQSLLGL